MGERLFRSTIIHYYRVDAVGTCASSGGILVNTDLLSRYSGGGLVFHLPLAIRPSIHHIGDAQIPNKMFTFGALRSR